jgi:hypothetical protein
MCFASCCLIRVRSAAPALLSMIGKTTILIEVPVQPGETVFQQLLGYGSVVAIRNVTWCVAEK